MPDSKETSPQVVTPEMNSELNEYMQEAMPTQAAVAPEVKPNSPEALKNFMDNAELNGPAAAVDPFAMSKNVIGDFRNPHLQNQFYERYKEHPMFKELGFSPFRDNEQIFNEKDSTFDQLRRASGAWASLTGIAFKDAATWGELSDTDTAKDFEHAMAVGSSSEGGVGGFATNMFVNSGYTSGIMLEMAAESLAIFGVEVALGIATVGSGGALSGATVPTMAAAAARAVAQAGSMGKKMKNFGKMLAEFQDISKARKFFSKIPNKAADFLNPLENTTEFIRGMKSLNQYKSWQKPIKGFGEFYKDTRNARLAFGESSLEGGMVQNQMERELLADFKSEHGRSPDKEEAIKLRNAAAQAGHTTAIINAPLIFLTNKLTFDGMMRPAVRRMPSSITNYGKAGKTLRVGGKEVPLSKNFFTRTGQILRNPKVLATEAGRGSAKYIGANIGEGLQEVSQEVVSGASEEYYSNQFKGNAFKGGYMSYVGSNLQKQVSAQGLETFASGFLMQMMIGPVTSVVGSIAKGGFADGSTATGAAGQTIGNQALRVADMVSPLDKTTRTVKDEDGNDVTEEVHESRYEKATKAQREKAAVEAEALDKQVETLNDLYEDPTKYYAQIYMLSLNNVSIPKQWRML